MAPGGARAAEPATNQVCREPQKRLNGDPGSLVVKARSSPSTNERGKAPLDGARQGSAIGMWNMPRATCFPAVAVAGPLAGGESLDTAIAELLAVLEIERVVASQARQNVQGEHYISGTLS